MTTQLPTWHGEPVPPSGSTASSGAGAGAPPDPSPTPGNHPAPPPGGRHAEQPQPRHAEVRRGAPGTVIGGRYSLRTAIGNGGMGTVWRATDTLLRRDVAVKEVLLPDGMAASDRDAMYQRTLREARAAAALSHPSVVQVYDVVTEDGRPWIVMELLQSRSLAEMIMEDGPLAPRAVAKIGIALLGALEVAHAAGVLHRDVKPANVLICGDGRCVLTDFGVARMPADSQLTTPGMVLGSPHFISPERAIGAAFGPPSDLFSLGVTLYTAVEGRPPFDRRDPFETMRAVVEEPPAPAHRAGALAGVLYGLLEKDPERRWDVPAARGVLRDLLSGALASVAPAHETDPYAVVRPAPFVPPQAPQPTGQIGGRAMLAPGESLSSAIRRIGTAPTQRGPAPGERTTVQHAAAVGDTGLQAQPGGGYRPTGRVFGAGAAATSLGARLRQLPSRAKLAIGAGAALAVLIATAGIAALTAGGGAPAAQHTAKASPSVAQPLIPVQEYADPTKGISLNVPKSWVKKPASSYVDFVDPADESRRLRINVESAGRADAHQFLVSAENGLKNPKRCPAPYQEVSLQDTKLAGRDGARLEYTCGTGDQMRHGIWTATVLSGKSYHFFLTVPDSQFAASKVIFDEMARSFKITTG